MRFYHRTSLSPDDVLSEADRYFSAMGTAAESGLRNRTFRSSTGQVLVDVRPEGGHYTRVAIETDQLCQGEVEKFAKGFFTVVHHKAHPAPDALRKH